MNTAQRKFLIERIQGKVKEKIELLEKTRLEYPSTSNYIFKAILNNNIKLQDSKVILEALKNKAINAKEGSNWLSGDRMGYDKETTIKIPIESLIIIPKDYEEELERVKQVNHKIREQVNLLKIQLDTIEMRVQLASDKTLQKLINEVDDMGDLSLMDTKLKFIE